MYYPDTMNADDIVEFELEYAAVTLREEEFEANKMLSELENDRIERAWERSQDNYDCRFL